jgi:hypothetical protein
MLNNILNKSNEIKKYYDNSNDDIKQMIKNLCNACYRFGLNNTQTIYMIDQALKPFKNDLLIEMLGGNYE